MNSIRPVRIRFTPKGNNFWFALDFELEGGAIVQWYPRLADQLIMARAVALCEDWKYKNGEGRFGTMRFLLDAFWRVALPRSILRSWGFLRPNSLRSMDFGRDQLPILLKLLRNSRRKTDDQMAMVLRIEADRLDGGRGRYS